MFIDINKIGSSPVDFDHRFTLPPLEVEGWDRVAVRELRLRGSAVRGDRGVEFAAHLAGRLQLRCGRCLEPYENLIAADFDLVIVPEAVEFGSGEIELTEEDLELFYAEEGKAHLAEIAREQLYLNLPLKPICHEDCQGLCPTCGGNRNRIQCGCRTEAEDPRLAPLAEIRKRLRQS